MKEWIKAAGIRAIKTVAQTAVATIGTAVAMGKLGTCSECFCTCRCTFSTNIYSRSS